MQYEFGKIGGHKGIGKGRDSPASPGELVGYPGTAMEISWRKECDIRSQEQCVALDSTLLNN
jgi:hypothetical protein